MGLKEHIAEIIGKYPFNGKSCRLSWIDVCVKQDNCDDCLASAVMDAIEIDGEAYRGIAAKLFNENPDAITPSDIDNAINLPANKEKILRVKK